MSIKTENYKTETWFPAADGGVSALAVDKKVDITIPSWSVS